MDLSIVGTFALLVTSFSILASADNRYDTQFEDDEKQMMIQMRKEMFEMKSKLQKMESVVHVQDMEIKLLKAKVLEISDVAIENAKINNKNKKRMKRLERVLLSKQTPDEGPSERSSEEMTVDEDNGVSRDAVTTRSKVNRRQLTADESPVAFSVYLDHWIEHAGPGHTLKLNQAILNDGSHYNVHTGVFTCPRDGVYLFSFFFDDTHVQQALVKLVIDGTLGYNAAAEPHNRYQNIQGGNVLITRLSTGQSVWLEDDRSQDEYIEGTPDFRPTTFSGVYLYP